MAPNEFLVIPATTPIGDGDEDRNGESGGFGSREVKLGTSYDPRRSVGGGGMQYQLQRPFQDEFLAVHKMKRLPQQYQQFPHQPQSPQQQHESQQIQRQPKLPPTGGAESPRKTGRNRTHTMVLSEAAQVADELAKVTAAANIRAEKEERETKEKEAKAREEVESEQRQRDEAEPQAKQEMEEPKPASDEPTSDEPKDIDEGVTETTEENVSDSESVGESTGNVAIEEESTAEALHVTPESEPTGKESESEEIDANPTKVDEEPRMQEVDIATASIPAETSNVEEGERTFEADAGAEVEEDRKEVL